jgi:outer membrane biosynthesis protein TonB
VAGCINRVAVTRGVSRVLDVSAIRAVTGWVFKPAVVKGAAVSLTMPVEVRFSTN